ncbi:hypothetical protein [Micromonospora profundi]|uniref:hypothetical protein n=1 Tax=Micromonospora profundi TaxID=1420889 RepID=UPI003656B655
MMAAVQWANPGALGFVAGSVLIGCAVGLLLLVSGRRADAERAVEVATTPPGRPAWHPSQGPRREPVTELLPRCADQVDATVLIPSQRAVRRG